MHHIYHTEAYVLGSSPKGEDSKILRLYTRELGLVYAHAQGVRKLSSKLRFTLQDFSLASVDLVRGKEVWRVTTASPMRSHAAIRRNRFAEVILARVHSLLVRLVTGEEVNDEIYDILGRTYDMLEKVDRTPEEYRALELLAIARILMALGYLPRGVVEEERFTEPAFQHRMIQDINQALAATQL